MKNIKTVIFDLDGTLLDTLDGITYYINSVLRDEGFAPIDSSLTKTIIGDGAEKLISRACGARGVFDDERVHRMLVEYKKRYDNDPFHLVSPYEDISPVIDELKSRGVRLAVLSNKPEFATRGMVEHFFGDRFDTVRGGSDKIPLKPAPDAAQMILKELSSHPDECAFVGDGEADVLTAENLGAALPISVLWGFRTKKQLESVGALNFAASPRDLLKYFE